MPDLERAWWRVAGADGAADEEEARSRERAEQPAAPLPLDPPYRAPHESAIEAEDLTGSRIPRSSFPPPEFPRKTPFSALSS